MKRQLVVDAALTAPTRLAAYLKEGSSESWTMFVNGPAMTQAAELVDAAFRLNVQEIVIRPTGVAAQLRPWVDEFLPHDIRMAA